MTASGTLRVVGVDAAVLERRDGVLDEAGLAIGMAAVSSSPMPRDPDLPTVGSLGIIREVLDHAATIDEAIQAFTSGADMGADGITLIAPEIAENGNTVPIEVSAPGATAILVLAMGNPTPGVAQFNFGPLAAAQSASTRSSS